MHLLLTDVSTIRGDIGFFSKKAWSLGCQSVIYRIPNSLGHYRVGITIKARGSSVERNRVKRQIREFFRTHTANLGCFDYNVVIPSHKKMVFNYPKRLAECLRGQFLHVVKDR